MEISLAFKHKNSTIFQIIFYNGWFKTAECIINPYGNDGDDFDVDWLIDRNRTVSNLIGDELHTCFPELVKDYFWNLDVPITIPFGNILGFYKQRHTPRFLQKVEEDGKIQFHVLGDRWRSELPKITTRRWDEMMLELTGYFAEHTEVLEDDKAQLNYAQTQSLVQDERNRSEQQNDYENLLELRKNWSRMIKEVNEIRFKQQLDVLYKKEPKPEIDSEVKHNKRLFSRV